MTTPVKVINGGLSKIAASRVSTIAPPQTNLERFMADNYEQWRDAELSAHRWRFALEYRALTLQSTSTTLAKPYAFGIPNDAMRAIREKGTEWEQRRKLLYSAYPTLTALFVVRVTENDFDPLFAEVLSCKVAFESAEYVTQSNTKKADAKVLYDEAVDRARQMNAFLTGSEEVSGEDDPGTEYTWLTSREGR